MTVPVEELPRKSTSRRLPAITLSATIRPFRIWNAEGAEHARAAIAQPPVDGTPMGIYVHLPFCRRRCHFCYFRVYTGTGRQAGSRDAVTSTRC